MAVDFDSIVELRSTDINPNTVFKARINEIIAAIKDLNTRVEELENATGDN